MKISELPSATTATTAAIVVSIQDGIPTKITFPILKTLITPLLV